MNLVFNQSEFERVADISSYNNNYYKHKKLDYVIYEICHEDDNYYEYFLIEDNKNIFIGCSGEGFNGEEYVTLDFKTPYT